MRIIENSRRQRMGRKESPLAVLKPEEQRRTFERLANIRDIVFGVQDGVLTTAGVLAGLSGAVSGRSQIILAALASTAAGALSMGAGAYLGTRAEIEVIRTEMRHARDHARSQPYIVQESLLNALAERGSLPRGRLSGRAAAEYGSASALLHGRRKDLRPHRRFLWQSHRRWPADGDCLPRRCGSPIAALRAVFLGTQRPNRRAGDHCTGPVQRRLHGRRTARRTSPPFDRGSTVPGDCARCGGVGLGAIGVAISPLGA